MTEAEWDSFSKEVYERFWGLTMYDIHVPKAQYKSFLKAIDTDLVRTCVFACCWPLIARVVLIDTSVDERRFRTFAPRPTAPGVGVVVVVVVVVVIGRQKRRAQSQIQ